MDFNKKFDQDSDVAKREEVVDLESQFILRLPPDAAKVLREAIDSGDPHLKDRMSIKLENDVRYGEVRLDHWMFFAKVVDLPTIIESLKTIDRKNFYKTADICQMMICKEEDDRGTSDEEEERLFKNKKDNKVDKKFLWPHGITPPMKNVRKRRFRKTLRKKYVEAPEIEKEVKRLLKGDSEAVHVKWELVMEEDDKSKASSHNVKEEPLVHRVENNTHIKPDLAEHDIFGGAVSDSEEEEDASNMVNIMDLDEDNSRLSRFSGELDSHLSDSATFQQQDSQSATDGASMADGGRGQSSSFITQFNREMFIGDQAPSTSSFEPSSIKSELYTGAVEEAGTSGLYDNTNEYFEDNVEQLSTETIQARMDALDQEISDLENKRRQQELELMNIENQTLRQRFQSVLDNLNMELMEKDQEYQKLATMLDTPPDC
ncbi:hypothetical protein M8J77_017399 [Diaphorina citri]|nr:hypothetical protein M8J77_017399 [Diaphorina citri]